MDWEGCDLEAHNLKSIREFKQKWKCPITHYLNASYYTNPKTKDLNITDEIKSILTQDDELGLHLHAPKHFVENAQVELKTSPTFSSFGDYNAGEEFGQEVMLHGYSKDEIKKMISFSTSILNKKGFRGIFSFRAGGWMCDEKIVEALEEENFHYESSATVASLLNGSTWEGDNLQRYIELIWDDITPQSKPYWLESSQKKIIEIPNNLGAIDYWQDHWIDELVDISIKNSQQDKDYICVINSHQETFEKNAYKLDQYLKKISKEFEVSFVVNKNIN